MPSLPLARDLDALRRQVADWRRAGRTVGFVPTMGALHEGHLSLARLARSATDQLVASVFVNPGQFAPGEDFDAYPRDLERDGAQLAETGCDLLYAPDPAAMYPPDFATTVVIAGPAEGLESAARPHFFRGVATVVAKLLIQVAPDVAVFGEKDYQQLAVIRRLARDLDLPVRILAGPTVREPDGLAMSSRNAYLDAAARLVAGRLNTILADAAHALSAGERVDVVERSARAALEAAGFDAIDYVAVRAADTLAAFGAAPIDRSARVLAAARVGEVRLIDNLAADPPKR